MFENVFKKVSDGVTLLTELPLLLEAANTFEDIYNEKNINDKNAAFLAGFVNKKLPKDWKANATEAEVNTLVNALAAFVHTLHPVIPALKNLKSAIIAVFTPIDHGTEV